MTSRLARFDPWPAIALLLALIPALAILQPGMPQTADGFVHLLRAAEVGRLWQAGVFYPRWAPDFYLGYGYPFFNFYAPGAHLAASLLAVAGLGTTGGVVALQVLALALYPTGAYLFSRALLAPWAGRQGALLSAALYLYAPLRFRELFTQGNLSQLVALAWLPWCAWLLTEALLRRSPRWAAAAALSNGALIYLHAPTAFVALPSLAAYALLLAVAAGDARRRASLAAGVMLVALALSAPFWLPAVSEMRYVNINAISTGMFNARLNLAPLGELLAPARPLDEASINPPFPRALGTAQALLAVAGLAVALHWVVRGSESLPGGQFDLSQRRLGALLLGVGGLLLASLALILPAAGPIWDRLPLANIIAFPWRLLGPALLWASLLGGAAMAQIPARFRTTVLATMLVVVPVGVAPYLFPRDFAPVGDVGLPGLARYELAGGARATASANEYLPVWVSDAHPPTALASEIAAGAGPDRLDRDALPSGGQAQVVSPGPREYVYRLALPQETRVRFRQFYFPGWRAWLDEEPARISPDARHGLIEVDAPAGEHTLRLAFGSTPPRTAGALLALGGVIAVAVAAWRGGKSTARAARQDAIGFRDWQPALLAGAVILALTGLKLFAIEPYTQWFRISSPVDAPAGMQNAVHARFANGLELLGYNLSHTAVRQGDELRVRLFWRALEPQQSDSRPYLHLDAITGEATWANETKWSVGGKPSTSWPSGYYVVDDYRLRVEPETPPMIASLRVGLLDKDDQIIPLFLGEETVTVAPVRIIERNPFFASKLPGREQTYRLGSNIELLGHAVALDAKSAELVVTLYWRTREPLTEDYTVFLHASDAAGTMIAGKDGPPANGLYPSSSWLPGQIIVDERRLPLPARDDSSDLQIEVGLYRLEDGSRLPVKDREGAQVPGDQIPLDLTPPTNRVSPATRGASRWKLR